MIKRSLAIFLTIVLLVALAALPVSAATVENQTPPAISVTGHAEVTVVPDVCIVTAGIVTNGTTVELAREENDRVMRQIMDALLLQGIERTKIATSQFYLQPIYQSDAKVNGVGAISGYRLQNNVTVVIEDLAKIGTVIDAAFKAGANEFQGLRFGLKDDSLLRDALLKKAVQDGRHKAEIVAEALGVNLGRPLSVSEAGHTVPLSADTYRTLKAMPTGTPVEAGTITVGLDVNMVFAM